MNMMNDIASHLPYDGMTVEGDVLNLGPSYKVVCRLTGNIVVETHCTDGPRVVGTCNDSPEKVAERIRGFLRWCCS